MRAEWKDRTAFAHVAEALGVRTDEVMAATKNTDGTWIALYTTGTDDLDTAVLWCARLAEDAGKVLMKVGEPVKVPGGLDDIRARMDEIIADKLHVPRFELGRVVTSAGLVAALCTDEAIGPFEVTTGRWTGTATSSTTDLSDAAEIRMQFVGSKITPLLERHVTGDWGDLDDEDKQENERSVKNGTRILSRYDEVVPGVDVYVITDGVSDACPACWTGVGECEPEKGSRHGGMHFRDDLPPRRLSTTVMRPEDY